MSNTNQSQKPELLMPAGSLQKLEYAFAYGADAVYLGVPFFSLRARENEFTLEDLYKAREISTKAGKKIYVTANVFAKNRKIKSFVEHMAEWAQVKPDAFIMGDPGLMMMAREAYPDLNLHLSVQANSMNWQTVKFWYKSLGISRVILSRELHINEIKEIKQRVPEVELEAFVHGSICIAYSGRCLMSSYMSRRDANQGVCDNSCREKYKIHAVDKKEPDSDYFLEDLRGNGELYQVSEDENGTFLMNAKDLRLIQHLKEITDAGVSSFKVEGRTKSLNYVALVSKAYRKAIDDMWEGREFDQQLCEDLEKVANRGYDTGFMIRETSSDSQNYDTSVSRNFKQRYGGLIQKPESTAPDGFVPIEVRNKIVKGQACEVLFANSPNIEFNADEILDSKLMPVDAAHGGAGLYYFKVDQPVPFDQRGILSLKIASSELPNIQN